jgi:hypothetical protein
MKRINNNIKNNNKTDFGFLLKVLCVALYIVTEPRVFTFMKNSADFSKDFCLNVAHEMFLPIKKDFVDKFGADAFKNCKDLKDKGLLGNKTCENYKLNSVLENVFVSSAELVNYFYSMLPNLFYWVEKFMVCDLRLKNNMSLGQMPVWPKLFRFSFLGRAALQEFTFRIGKLPIGLINFVIIMLTSRSVYSVGWGFALILVERFCSWQEFYYAIFMNTIINCILYSTLENNEIDEGEFHVATAIMVMSIAYFVFKIQTPEALFNNKHYMLVSFLTCACYYSISYVIVCSFIIASIIAGYFFVIWIFKQVFPSYMNKKAKEVKKKENAVVTFKRYK